MEEEDYDDDLNPFDFIAFEEEECERPPQSHSPSTKQKTATPKSNRSTNSNGCGYGENDSRLFGVVWPQGAKVKRMFVWKAI